MQLVPACGYSKDLCKRATKWYHMVEKVRRRKLFCACKNGLSSLRHKFNRSECAFHGGYVNWLSASGAQQKLRNPTSFRRGCGRGHDDDVHETSSINFWCVWRASVSVASIKTAPKGTRWVHRTTTTRANTRIFDVAKHTCTSFNWIQLLFSIAVLVIKLNQNQLKAFRGKHKFVFNICVY